MAARKSDQAPDNFDMNKIRTDPEWFLGNITYDLAFALYADGKYKRALKKLRSNDLWKNYPDIAVKGRVLTAICRVKINGFEDAGDIFEMLSVLENDPGFFLEKKEEDALRLFFSGTFLLSMMYREGRGVFRNIKRSYELLKFGHDIMDEGIVKRVFANQLSRYSKTESGDMQYT